MEQWRQAKVQWERPPLYSQVRHTCMVLCRCFNIFSPLFIPIISNYHIDCASETCKEASKIASEFQVSRRWAAELQIAQKDVYIYIMIIMIYYKNMCMLYVALCWVYTIHVCVYSIGQSLNGCKINTSHVLECIIWLWKCWKNRQNNTGWS
jgi:hypothetical protein